MDKHIPRKCKQCGQHYTPGEMVRPHECRRGAGQPLGSKVKPLPGQKVLPLTGVPDVPKEGVGV